MKLYQLGKYNTRTDLTEQGKLIRDFVLVHHDYNSINDLIKNIEFIEEESIIILSTAVLAGYWTSYYGFNWTEKQEIDFWEMVYSKNPNLSVAIITLAQAYRGHSIKTLKEVIGLYLRAIEIHSEHYYSLELEDRQILLKDDDLKFQFIKIELDIYEKNWKWNKADWEEEYPFLIERCKGDQKMLDYVRDRIDKILKG
jgi:hypothetical protein